MNVYEVIGSYSYVDLHGTRLVTREGISGTLTSLIDAPKRVYGSKVFNTLAENAEDAIKRFKENLEDIANEDFKNSGHAHATSKLVVVFDAIESVHLLAVGVYQ